MKKQIWVVLLAIVMVMSLIACVACQDDPATYTLTYAAGEGSGTAPEVESYKEGETVTIKANPFTAPANKEFDGWSDGTTKYQANGTLKMPAANVTLTAQWKDKATVTPDPVVTLESISAAYDGTIKVNGSIDKTKLTVTASYSDNSSKEVTDYTLGTIDTSEAGGAQVIITYKEGEITKTFTLTITIVQPDTPQPVAPVITDEVNAVILHESETASGAKIVGELMLFADGTGVLNIVNTKSGFSIIDNSVITYTIDTNGVFTILTATDAKLTLPAIGSVEGNTVSITIENASVSGGKTQYAFESELHALTLNYGFSVDGATSSEWYYSEGTEIDLTNITRNGYTLKGFTVDGTNKDVSYGREFAMPSEDIEITYIWEQIQVVDYTVTYKAGDGVGEDYTEKSTSASYKLLGKVAADEKFSREGWALIGWTVNGEEKSFGATITLSGDTVVTARYRQTFTVEFAGLDVSGVTKGGNWEAITDARYSEVSKLTLPASQGGMFVVAYVERSGFTLVGWQSSADNKTYAPGEQVAITQNTTFTAIWQQNSVVAPTDFDGRWICEQGMYIASADLTINEITISGKTVTGDIAGELTISGNTATMSVSSFNYTLTIDNGVLTISAKQSVSTTTYTGEFTKFVPTDKTLADYEGYWIGEIEYYYTVYDLIMIKNGILYMQEGEYDPEEYELTEDRSGRNLVATYTKTTTGWLPTTITITLTFISDNEFNIVCQRNSTTAEANFTKTTVHTVTYVLGDDYHGEEDAPEAVQVVAGRVTSAPTLAKVTGWKLIGWFAEGASQAFDFSQPITEDITLTAKWEQITQVTVTFAIQSGITGVTAPATQTIAFNATATEPEQSDMVISGYRFDGWFNGSNKFDFATPITEDITLTAKWSRAYTITYAKPDGASGEVPASETVYLNDTYTFIANPFEMEGYEFLGWKVGNASYINKVGATRKISGNLALTAVFGVTYVNKEDPQDPDLSLVIRSDELADFNGDSYSYSIEGAYITLLYDGYAYIIFWTDSESKECQASDGLNMYSFTGTDSTGTEVTLSFDGIGNATIGGKTVAYTTVLDNYGYIVGIKINEQEIMFEQGDDGLVINVAIELEGETYTFGTVGTNPNPPIGSTEGKLSDFVGTYGYESLDLAGSNVIEISSSMKIFKLELYWNGSRWSVNHWRNTGAIASTDVAVRDESYTDTIGDKDSDNVVLAFKASGKTVKLTFSIADTQKTLSIQIDSAEGPVWNQLGGDPVEETASLTPYNGTYIGDGIMINGYDVVYVMIDGDSSITLMDEEEDYFTSNISEIKKVDGLVVATFEQGTLTVNADGSITVASGSASATFEK